MKNNTTQVNPNHRWITFKLSSIRPCHLIKTPLGRRHAVWYLNFTYFFVCLFIWFNWIQKLPHIALAVYCPNIWTNICPTTDVIAHRALILGLFRITKSWKRSKIILWDIYCKSIKKTFILLSILLPAWLYAPIQSLFSSHLLLFVTNELRLRLHKASVSVRL